MTANDEYYTRKINEWVTQLNNHGAVALHKVEFTLTQDGDDLWALESVWRRSGEHRHDNHVTGTSKSVYDWLRGLIFALKLAYEVKEWEL